MTGPAPSTPAWPFLVGRGRVLGYRTLLAPDLLIAGDDYAILNESVVPADQEGRAEVVEVVTRTGRPLTVVHSIHQVMAAEIVPEPGTAPGEGPVKDRHSRPLQVVYGFVCQGRLLSDPDPADLQDCLASALASYRRFLADENGFALEAGSAFPLRTQVISRSAVPDRPPATVSSPRMEVRDAAPRRRPDPAPLRMRAILAVLGLIVVVLGLIFVFWPQPEPAPEPTPTPSPTSVPFKSPGGKGTLVPEFRPDERGPDGGGGDEAVPGSIVPA